MNDVVKVRASSWAGLFNCAYQWEAVHILGMRSPSSPRALLGTSVHAGTAAFDTARMLGEYLSVDDAAGLVVDTLHNPSDDVDWKGSDISVQQAEFIALKLHTMYCTDWSPKYTFKAVELQTKPLVIDVGGGLSLELTGTLDRARFSDSGRGVGIKDVKTGGAAVSNGIAKTKGHAAQIGTYEILYEHTTGERITEPGEIIGLKTRGKPEIGTGMIYNAKQMMLGDEHNRGLIEVGADMIRAGLFPPNPQAMTCSARYCVRWKTCPYHE